MLHYILVGVIVVLGIYIFLLERNRKNIIQAWDEDIERFRRERDEHYAERDEKRQEQEDNEQELIKELRKNKIKQACSLFRVMFRRYREAGIPKRKAMVMAVLDTLYIAVDEDRLTQFTVIGFELKKTELFEHLRDDVPELLEDYDADDFKITDEWDMRDLSIDDYI